MPISVQCSECNTKYNVADTMAGKRVKCRHCSHVMSVPQAGTEAGGAVEAVAPIAARKSAADSIVGSKPGDSIAGKKAPEPVAAAPAPKVTATVPKAVIAPSKKPAATPEFDPAAVVIEREDEDGNVEQVETPVILEPREPSVPFEFPQAQMLEQVLPWALAGLGFLWLIGASASKVEGHPKLPFLRIFIYVGLFVGIVWPLSLVGVKMALGDLKISPPPNAAWRAFAGFCFPYTLACVFGQMSNGIGGLITGLVFGLIVAAGAVGFLFRFRPQQASVAIKFGGGGYVAGIVVSVLVLLGINAAVLSTLQHGGTAHTLDRSPLAAALSWDSTPPEQPRGKTTGTQLATTTPTTPDQSTTQPENGTQPPVVSSELPDPSMQPQVTQREPTANSDPPVTSHNVVTPPKPHGGTPSPVTPKPHSIFDTDSRPGSSASPNDTGSPQPGTVAASSTGFFSPGQLTQEGGATVAVAEIKPASPIVSRVTPAASIGRIDGMIDAATPSNWVAVIRSRTTESDKVELWHLQPLEQRGRPVVFRHGSGPEHYVVSPGGDLLAHVAQWPKLGAQVWSFNDEKIQRNIELSTTLGTPTVLGFCADGLLAIHWQRSPDCGVEIFDVRAAQRARATNVPAHDDAPGALAISNDGKFIAISTRAPSDATKKEEAQLQYIDIGGGNRAIRKLPIPSLDPHWPVAPTGIAFSPDGQRTALLFEKDGNALIVGWRQSESKPIYEHIFSVPFREADAPEFTGQPIVWLPDGNAWLLYGRSVVDNESGRIIADLGINQVKHQHVIDAHTVALEVALPADAVAAAPSAGRDQVLLVKLDSDKLSALETTPRVIPTLHGRPLTRPATLPSATSLSTPAGEK